MDGKPPFGRGRLAARFLAYVIDAAAWVGSRVPALVAHGLAGVGGSLEWAARPAKRRLLAENIAHAVGGDASARRVRRLVRREVRNEAHRSADLLWALGRPEEFLATVEVVGAENARAVAASGRGLILLGTHVGGWEVATAVPGAVLPVPTSVVVADNWLAWAIEHARVAVGLRVLYPENAGLRAVRLLEGGEALLMLGDDGRFASHRARVRLLDGEADVAAGVATLARLAQAPIVGFSVLPVGLRRWRVTIDPPIEPPPRAGGEAAEHAVLQQVADRWSEVIRAHPEHWAANFPIAWHLDHSG